MKRMFILAILCGVCFASIASAKRTAPDKVAPVEHDGVQYVVVHFGVFNGTGQNGGYIEARDKKSRKKIWGLQVYKTVYNEQRERDVQDVFITSMQLDEMKKLIVLKDERNRVHHVDIAARKMVPAAEHKAAGVAQDNTAFALDLYRHLSKSEDGNLFYSPYSISTALAMTYAGARGKTATQMEQVLHFDAKQGAHAQFKELQARVNNIGTKGRVTLNVASSLWPDRKYKFLDSFMKLVNGHYEAAITPINFGDAKEAADLINTWVEDKTNDLIQDILKADDIDPLTVLALVNAIYFKGTWQYQFKEEDTSDQVFSITPSNRVKVPMMQQAGEFQYGENAELQVLELPYDGGDVSMVVILPRKVDGLAALEKKLSAETLSGWTGLLRPQKKVNVFFPRFKMEYRMYMKETLKAMGMPDAFSDVEADFSGMDGTRMLYIDKVIHKAFVEVNEEGTEAAAATVVLMVPKKGGIGRTPTFRADHPFLFLIRDKVTGSVLFVGRMVDPRA